MKEILLVLAIPIGTIALLFVGFIGTQVRKEMNRNSKNESMKYGTQAPQGAPRTDTSWGISWARNIPWAKLKPGTFLGDVIWMAAGLAFINWFCAQALDHIWDGFWAHKSFWATQIALLLACVGLRNTKNDIGVGICIVVLLLCFYSIVTVIQAHMLSPDYNRPKGLVEVFTEPGRWSEKLDPKRVYSVTNTTDRKWRRTFVNPDKVTHRVYEDPLPYGDFDLPTNMKFVEFFSERSPLKIELYPPKDDLRPER
ncbi:MAG TPA: hypothetical protein VGE35_04375 [Candidatus Paceibacterota bacterium]